MAEREGIIRQGRGQVCGSGSGNGIDTSRFLRLPDRAMARRRLGIPTDAEVVGFVGRLTRDKGIADLIAILDAALARPKIQLLLVGEFECGDDVGRDTRVRIDGDPRIVRVPWSNDPGSAYRAMDVMAFPSYREGLPNAPLEAQYCGTPVVGYAATGTVDAVCHGRTGTLVPVGDRAALARAINQVLDNPDLRANMSRHAHEWVRDQFDQKRVWGDLVTRYRAWLGPEDR